MVNKGYESFTKKAAEGRNMDIDDLLKIASGRVWTGEQAKENGLVDEIGGLYDAIEIAAAKAGVEDDYKVRYYPAQKTVLEELIFSYERGCSAVAVGVDRPMREEGQALDLPHLQLDGPPLVRHEAIVHRLSAFFGGDLHRPIPHRGHRAVGDGIESTPGDLLRDGERAPMGADRHLRVRLQDLDSCIIGLVVVFFWVGALGGLV